MQSGEPHDCTKKAEAEEKSERPGDLKGQQSAQRAEEIALSRALRLAKEKRVKIYTDSASKKKEMGGLEKVLDD